MDGRQQDIAIIRVAVEDVVLQLLNLVHGFRLECLDDIDIHREFIQFALFNLIAECIPRRWGSVELNWFAFLVTKSLEVLAPRQPICIPFENVVKRLYVIAHSFVPPTTGSLLILVAAHSNLHIRTFMHHIQGGFDQCPVPKGNDRHHAIFLPLFLCAALPELEDGVFGLDLPSVVKNLRAVLVARRALDLVWSEIPPLRRVHLAEQDGVGDPCDWVLEPEALS